jgi:hypothetical protein
MSSAMLPVSDLKWLSKNDFKLLDVMQYEENSISISSQSKYPLAPERFKVDSSNLGGYQRTLPTYTPVTLTHNKD